MPYAPSPPRNRRGAPSWTSVFGSELADLDSDRPGVVAITAAMLDPTGLGELSRRHPERVIDVDIAELTASGCQIVRVARPTQDNAVALSTIARTSQVAVIADIHFQPRYVFATIEAGCAAVRVNLGNLRQVNDMVREVGLAARDHGTSTETSSDAASRRPTRR